MLFPDGFPHQCRSLALYDWWMALHLQVEWKYITTESGARYAMMLLGCKGMDSF